MNDISPWVLPAGVDLLADYATEIGSNLRLVQGAGGNVSVKEGAVVWIKASGTRLADARVAPIFVAVDVAAARPAVLETEALEPFVLAEISPPGLRPSIETALHVLLPHRFVVHVHAVGSIAAGLDDLVLERLASFPDWFRTLVVPYAKPGIMLARAVNSVLDGPIDDSAPLALVLRNHGLVVGAGDLVAINRIITSIESIFVTGVPPVLIPIESSVSVDGFVPLAPAGTLTMKQAGLLMHGPLTPDSAVYLGATPFGFEDQVTETCSCIVHFDGSVSLRAHFGADERESAASLIDVARLASPGARISAIPGSDVDELLDWDAEKWRTALKR